MTAFDRDLDDSDVKHEDKTEETALGIESGGIGLSNENPLSKEEESELLLSALSNPKYLIENGFPVVHKRLEERFSTDEICNYWNVMLSRKSSKIDDANTVVKVCLVLDMQEDNDSIPIDEEAGVSASSENKRGPKKKKQRSIATVDYNYLHHQKKNQNSTTIAAMKAMSLISSGWFLLPRRFSKKSNNQYSKGWETSLWCEPLHNNSEIPDFTSKECLTLAMRLNDAWNFFIQRLRTEIESHIKTPFIPEEVPKVHTQRKIVPVQTFSNPSVPSASPIISPTPRKRGRRGRKKTTVPVSSNGALNAAALDQSMIPKHVQNMMNTRARFVTENDPRPSIHCTWCGPKQWTRKVLKAQGNIKVPTIVCAACQILYSQGWRMDDASATSNSFVSSTANNRRWADYVFRNKEKGISLRSVKTFLLETTNVVAEQALLNPELLQRDNLEIPKNIVTTKKKKLEDEPIENEDDRDQNDNNDQASVSSSSTASTSSNHPQEELNQDRNDDINEIAPKQSELPQEISTEASNIKLPTLADLLEEEHGLQGILQSDQYGVLNVYFGSSTDITLHVLQSLATGKLPLCVQMETPFLRCQAEIEHLNPEGGAPPTRFIGVTRIFEQDSTSNQEKVTLRPNGKFGVEIPSLQSEDDNKILLRADFDREDVAGQLYTFLYRLLFGPQKVQEKLNDCNDLMERKRFINDTLLAFGAIRKDV